MKFTKNIIVFTIVAIIIVLSIVLTFVPEQFNQDPLYQIIHPNSSIKKIKFPKKIFQTYHSIEKIPNYIHENRRMYAPKYEVFILDDKIGLEFLKYNFNNDVVNKYNELSGAHRADLLRYCLLYIHGGVYMDIKTILTRNIDSFLKFDGPQRLYSVKSMIDDTVYQGFIASTSKNPIFLELIKKILNTDVKKTKSDYLIFTRQMHDTVNKDATVTLFTEKCVKDGPTLDRYGLYCICVDKNGEKLFNIRDPNYPY